MNLIKNYFIAIATIISVSNSHAQTEIEKVSHAEPLYNDLVRDLGARKGEKELNAAYDFKKMKNYNENAFLVEYEFAPINRLGLEIEADFSFFNRTNNTGEVPNNKLENLRFSTQYSFFVSTKLKTTLAVGYTQIIEFNDFKNYGKSKLITGTVYNPFFVAAKRFHENFHTIIYTSPLIEHDFDTNKIVLNWQINTSFLYTIPQTKHFVGFEFNHEIIDRKYELTIRPQIKLKMNEKLALGFVAGIPVNKANENWSSFCRMIYEL